MTDPTNKLQLFEVLDGEYIDPEVQRPTHKLLGECESREQAHLLISQFPGKGRCYVWDAGAKRVRETVSWENKPKASN